MKYLTTLLVSVFLSLGLSGAVFAGKGSVGEKEYKNNCASCHGIKGKGDGQFAEFLKNNAPSLTTLSKDNGGIFPFERIFQVIDGRAEIKSHGPREMPIWGSEYIAEGVKTHGPLFGEWYGEDVGRVRILALINYLHKLQEK